MLYHTNILDQSQVRYIQYEPYLEDKFPVCGVGMVEDPQTCEEDLPEPSAENPDIGSDDGGENLEDKENEAEDREGKKLSKYTMGTNTSCAFTAILL